MLIIDNRKSIPLDTSRLDWSKDNIKWLDKNVLSIPLHDPALDEMVKFFSYEIASMQAWLFPDVNTSTAEFEIDFSHSYLRYYLRIGTKPDEHFDGGCDAECAELAARRWKAIAKNAGRTTYDSFRLLLTEDEESNIRRALYKLNVYTY